MKKLEHYRIANRLSQKDVADILNIPPLDYIAIEEGKADISVKQMLRLCEYYKITPDEFLSEKLPAIPSGEQEKEEPGKSLEKAPRSKRAARKQGLDENEPALEEQQLSEGEKKFLNFYAKLVVDTVLAEEPRLRKLEENPKGYHADDKRACVICGEFVSGKNSWYDNYGHKCMLCQKAIDTGTIPPEIAKDKDLYYTDIDLEVSFNLKRSMLNSWIKQGIVQARTIPGEDGKGIHFRLFLLSDNAAFLPPHEKLRVGGPVKERDANGKEEVVFYPWYCFVDPIEYLKDYGISRWFKFKPYPDK